MIEQSIQLGEPVEHRGVVIAPLFPRRQPVASYVTLEEAIPLGFHVGEIDEAGSVPELLARNPLDANVLLYDGEELLGAKQNRILNVTVLAAAGAETRIPVSCVEVGRWSSRSAAFASSPSHAYPELRRVKAQRLSAEPLARGTAQGAVWDEVRGKAALPRRPLAHRRPARHLRRSRERPRRPAQGVPARGRPDRRPARARRPALPRLRVQARDVRAPLPEAARRLPARRRRTPRRRCERGAARRLPRSGRRLPEKPALGRSRRGPPPRRSGVVGSGLTLEDELVQLCVFSATRSGPRTRVTRPSGRR